MGSGSEEQRVHGVAPKLLYGDGLEQIHGEQGQAHDDELEQVHYGEQGQVHDDEKVHNDELEQIHGGGLEQVYVDKRGQEPFADLEQVHGDELGEIHGDDLEQVHGGKLKQIHGGVLVLEEYKSVWKQMRQIYADEQEHDDVSEQ